MLALWPSYIAFLMSFVVILIMWVNHHELMRMVERVNYPILFANGLVWNLLFRTMVRSGLLRPECSPATIAGVRRAYYVGLSVYLLATVVALFQPWLGLLLNVSLWALWIRLGYRSA